MQETEKRDPCQIWTVLASRVEVLQFYEREMVHCGWKVHHELTLAHDRLVFKQPPAMLGVVVDTKWTEGTRFLVTGSENAAESHWTKCSDSTPNGVRGYLAHERGGSGQ